MYIDDDLDGNRILLGTCSEVARYLGVTTNQVFMWSTRRDRNGFPYERCRRRAVNGLKDVPHYDMDECREWHKNYTPNPGGYRMHKRNREDVVEEDAWPLDM